MRGQSEATRLSLWPKVKFTLGFTALAAYEFARGGHGVEVLNDGAHRHVLGWDKVGYFPSVVLSSEGLRLTFCVFEWFDTSGLIQDFCSRPHISLHQWVWGTDRSRGHCSSIWFWLFTGMNEGTRRGGRCGGSQRCLVQHVSGGTLTGRVTGPNSFQLKQIKELKGKRRAEFCKNLDFRRSEGEDSCAFFAIFLPVSSSKVASDAFWPGQVFQLHCKMAACKWCHRARRNIKRRGNVWFMHVWLRIAGFRWIRTWKLSRCFSSCLMAWFLSLPEDVLIEKG